MALLSIYHLFFYILHKTGIFILLLLLPVFLSGNKYPLPVNTTRPVKQALIIKEFPVLCYHRIAKNPDRLNELWISELQFDQHIKTLYDSGFHSITPPQLYNYLTKGTPLPPKPVMISFDDTHESHFSIAAPILEKYGFRGVFFIMTVCIGKKNYLSERQIKTLAANGHAIECHTYDHPSVKNITGEQWDRQIDKPKKRLEVITGQPVEHFAYPYGVWNAAAIDELKKRGIKSAYQLTGKHSAGSPLFTIERMLVQGNWTGKELIKQMTREFSR